MENNNCCKTKSKIAHELNLSYSSMIRRLKDVGIAIPKHDKLSPAEAKSIYDYFLYGFVPGNDK